MLLPRRSLFSAFGSVLLAPEPFLRVSPSRVERLSVEIVETYPVRIGERTRRVLRQPYLRAFGTIPYPRMTREVVEVRLENILVPVATPDSFRGPQHFYWFECPFNLAPPLMRDDHSITAQSDGFRHAVDVYVPTDYLNLEAFEEGAIPRILVKHQARATA